MNIILPDNLVDNLFVLAFVVVLFTAWGYFIANLLRDLFSKSNRFFDGLDDFFNKFKGKEDEYV